MYITDGLQIECEFINALLIIDFTTFDLNCAANFFYLFTLYLVEVIKIV